MQFFCFSKNLRAALCKFSANSAQNNGAFLFSQHRKKLSGDYYEENSCNIRAPRALACAFCLRQGQKQNHRSPRDHHNGNYNRNDGAHDRRYDGYHAQNRNNDLRHYEPPHGNRGHHSLAKRARRHNARAFHASAHGNSSRRQHECQISKNAVTFVTAFFIWINYQFLYSARTFWYLTIA